MGLFFNIWQYYTFESHIAIEISVAVYAVFCKNCLFGARLSNYTEFLRLNIIVQQFLLKSLKHLK